MRTLCKICGEPMEDHDFVIPKTIADDSVICPKVMKKPRTPVKERLRQLLNWKARHPKPSKKKLFRIVKISSPGVKTTIVAEQPVKRFINVKRATLKDKLKHAFRMFRRKV